ncbi:Crp/Fnr family transcriptional regulator [Pedobacter punctiformis]|uniref:Crp/Fnr family transcriptional regulator n=1 Tax=Pedobacter punctiformis TaxID=3004097 RepID=A0ABT4LA74_9SPHI|nr:Crp/Fnr family transcriptional regulator [Pedobacter sp. HCMS5-2]MCZ4244068.1 Crp/Fnr family transcriptional regulator [Pedobacter sp. HCMS5-2]
MSRLKNPTFEAGIFIDFLNAMTRIPKEIGDEIIKRCYPVSFKKNKFIASDATQEPSVYFIIKGIARGFIKEEGRDITTWLAKEGQLIGRLDETGKNLDDPEIMQALETTQLLAIPYTLINDLYQKFAETKELGLNILSAQYERTRESAILARIPSAEQRYQRFIKLSGIMINRLPLKCIASYLGIRMETLSRIRSKGRKLFKDSSAYAEN